jgi:hypothetical protein
VESQTNTPPDQLSETQIFQNTSSRFLFFVGPDRIEDDQWNSASHYVAYTSQKNLTYCFQIAIPSPFGKPTVTLFPQPALPALLRQATVVVKLPQRYFFSIFKIPTGVFTMTK